MQRTALLKQTFKLGWPISLQNILVTLLSMIDVVMVSHIGDKAIAAVGLSNRVLFVFMVIVLGLGWGVGILSAQYYGAGQTKKIRRSLLIAILFGTAILLPIVVGSYWFVDDILAFGTTDKDVIAIGRQYLWLTFPSLLFVTVIMVQENALRSMNQVKLPLVISALSIVINVILNFWLINGGLGVPELGVNGAAIATTIARLLQMGLLIIAIQKLKLPIAVKAKDLRLLNESKHWKKLIYLVLPMMLSFGVWSIGAFSYQLIYGRMGTNELAVISMLLPIESVFISLFFGIASACSIGVGQYLGKNDYANAWQLAKSFIIISPVAAIILGFISLLFIDTILAPYEGVSKTTFDLAYQVLMVMAICSWLKVTNLTLALGVLRAGGDNRFVLMTDIIGLWMVSLPLTWLAAFHWQFGLVGVFLVAYSEEITKAFLFGGRTISKKWMRNLTVDN
jgi:putative MATE family efflux protein